MQINNKWMVVKWPSGLMRNKSLTDCCSSLLVCLNGSLCNACVSLSEAQHVSPAVAVSLLWDLRLRSCLFFSSKRRPHMSFNLSAEVFQHVLLNGMGQDGAGLSNLPEDNSLPGTMTSLVPNANAMTRLDKVALLGFFRSGLVNESLATLKWCV